MANALVLLLLLLGCSRLVASQLTTCTTLDVLDYTNQSTPISGSSLPLCVRDDLQCCTASYVDNWKESLQNQLLQDGLRRELGPYAQVYRAAVEGTRNYILSDYLSLLFDSLPVIVPQAAVPGLRNVFVAAMRDELDPAGSPGITPPDFRPTLSNSFLQLTQQMANFIVGATPSKLAGKQTCVQSVLFSHVSQSTLNSINDDFALIWRGVLALSNIQSWYGTQVGTDLFGFKAQDECVDTLIGFSCARCWRNIPPLCLEACEAHVEGCFSPFYVGLRDQFNILWNVSTQLASSIEESAHDAVNRAPGLTDLSLDTDGASQLVSSINSACNSSLTVLDLAPLLNSNSSGRRRRHAHLLLPATVRSALQSLVGSYNYSADLEFCTDSSLYSTASTNCWDGETIAASYKHGRVMFNRNLNNFAQFGNSPVYMFNTTNLQRQANTLGTPINDYLNTPALRLLLPDDISIPEGSAYPAPTMPTTITPTAGAGTLQTTIALIAAAVMACLLLLN